MSDNVMCLVWGSADKVMPDVVLRFCKEEEIIE